VSLVLRAQNLAYCIIADEQPKSLFGEYKFDPFVSNQWMIVSTAKTMLITVIIVVINSSTAFDGNYFFVSSSCYKKFTSGMQSAYRLAWAFTPLGV